MKHSPGFLLSLALIGSVNLAAGLTVRVNNSRGVPQLAVNGQPVRSRMFWGAPGSAPINLSPAAQQAEFEFTAAMSATNGTLHFRFGETPGDVYLDDIEVWDLNANRALVPTCDFEAGPSAFTSRWTTWPMGAQNTVAEFPVTPGQGRDRSAALHVKLKSPPDGRWPDFHIYHQPRLHLDQGHRYRVRFWVRAEPARKLVVAFYRPGQQFTFLGGPPDPFVSQIKLAADVSVNFVSFPVGLPWPKPGEPVDWTGVDTQCERVLGANPQALLLPRIGLDPPPWWRTANRDEEMQWEDGSRKHHGVVASPKYRRDAAERLAALVRHLEEKFGERTAGYHPCGQNTGEWFYEDTWGAKLNGYAPADLREWRRWLKQRYGNDAALRKAWNDTTVSLESVVVPAAKLRHAAPNGVIRLPAGERSLIDFGQFQQEAMADCVLEFARAVRQASQGRKLVVFFYGYLFEFGAIRNDPATCGHYALRRVLNSPDIDVFCSPISYFDRGLGQSAPVMTAAESVLLAGKHWLNEDDTRTYLGTGKFPGWQDAVKTIEDTNAELARNVAQEALRNFGTWWMDLGATGWFNDARMWAEMKRLNALDEPLLKKPIPFRPEVAAVIDEQSMLHVATGGHVVTRPAVYEARAALGRMGAPYGQYLQDDVLNGRVKAKVYVFLTPWRMTAAERSKLLAATRGATRVWCYAPGYLDSDQPAPDAMRQLTGFSLQRVTPAKALATPTAQGHKLGMLAEFGAKSAVQPLFAAVDARPNEVLATFADGTAAVALRRGGDGASLFVGAPGLTPEILRLAAREARVHLFTETNCNVYANGPFVAVHTSQAGPLELKFGKGGPILDVLTGRNVGQGPKLSLNVKKGETYVLKIEAAKR